MFQDELEFFKSNQDDLVKKYSGKVLAIKGNEIIGVFQNAIDAYTEVQKQYELGTFMLQLCKPGVDAYTVTISSLNVTVR